MWIQGNDYAEMYRRFTNANGYVFYCDVVQTLMKCRREITYEQFHNLIDYAFRVPFKDDYGEFIHCIKYICGKTVYSIPSPQLRTPYIFDLPKIRTSLGLDPPRPIRDLTSALWIHPNYPSQSDMVPKLLQHYVFGKGDLKRGRSMFYDF